MGKEAQTIPNSIPYFSHSNQLKYFPSLILPYHLQQPTLKRIITDLPKHNPTQVMQC